MAEDNNIPAWVDPDYGYNPASPRKPNMREMMEMIAGKSVEEIYASGEDYSDISRLASDLLYGSVGSNEDTRDFTKITEVATDPATGQIDADKFVAATQIATSQMYGGTTVKYTSGGYQTDEAGNTVLDGNSIIYGAGVASSTLSSTTLVTIYYTVEDNGKPGEGQPELS